MEEINFKDDTKSCSKALLCYILIASFLQVIIEPVLSASGVAKSEVLTMASAIATSITSIMIIRRYQKRFHVNIHLEKWTASFTFQKYVVFFILSLGIFWGSSLLFQLVIEPFSNIIQFQTPDFTPSGSVISQLIDIAYSVLLAPIFEELIFRGVLLQKLKQYGTVFSIIVVSLLFGLLHGNLPQSFPTFFLSVCLCIVTLTSESIFPAISIHMIANGIATISNVLTTDSMLYRVIDYVLLIVILLALCILLYFLIKKKRPAYSKEEYSIRNYFTNWAGILFLLISVFNIIIMIQILPS